jgi:hypothetical protein
MASYYININSMNYQKNKNSFPVQEGKFIKKEGLPVDSTGSEMLFYNEENSSVVSDYCNNCGKYNHLCIQCKNPIISTGIIAFRFSSEKKIEYLMICRKHTLGYVDFLRGKYILNNDYYILNLIKQMTIEEKKNLLKRNFDELWKLLWSKTEIEYTENLKTMECLSDKESLEDILRKIDLQNIPLIDSRSCIYTSDTYSPKEKYNYLKKNYILYSLIKKSLKYEQFIDPEWGFPKGRRNYHEKDFDAALREFNEETGISTNYLKNIQNILPFEEIFIGSNYKCYKHKYYLMNIDYLNSLNCANFQYEEVSKMEWKTHDDCIKSIRSYNMEKKRLITNIHMCIQKYKLYFM